MTTNEVLRLDNLSCRRTRFDNARHGLSLTVRSGEYQILTTPPGFDSADMIPLVTGEVKIVSGTGTLLGYPLQKMSARRRRQLLREIGILPRLDASIAGLTLGEFLAIPLRISGVATSQIETRVRNSLTENKLFLQRSQMMSSLTPAQLRLAALAQALIKSPRLVIAELRDDQFDQQVTSTILRMYASHGGAVLAIAHGVAQAESTPIEPVFGSEVNAAF